MPIASRHVSVPLPSKTRYLIYENFFVFWKPTKSSILPQIDNLRITRRSQSEIALLKAINWYFSRKKSASTTPPRSLINHFIAVENGYRKEINRPSWEFLWDKKIALMTELDSWRHHFTILGFQINFTPRPVVADAGPTDSRPKSRPDYTLGLSNGMGYGYPPISKVTSTSLHYLILSIITTHASPG